MQKRYSQNVKCKNCRFEYSAPIATNALYMCPECHAYAACSCEYGFGPITPCTVFLGDKAIARIEGWSEFRLDSELLGIHRELSKGYKNLEVYEEAAAIICDEYLNSNREED